MYIYSKLNVANSKQSFFLMILSYYYIANLLLYHCSLYLTYLRKCFIFEKVKLMHLPTREPQIIMDNLALP